MDFLTLSLFGVLLLVFWLFVILKRPNAAEQALRDKIARLEAEAEAAFRAEIDKLTKGSG